MWLPVQGMKSRQLEQAGPSRQHRGSRDQHGKRTKGWPVTFKAHSKALPERPHVPKLPQPSQVGSKCSNSSNT